MPRKNVGLKKQQISEVKEKVFCVAHLNTLKLKDLPKYKFPEVVIIDKENRD